MLKNDGRERRRKTTIKCDGCKESFLLEEQELIQLGTLKYVECPACGLQKILKK